MHNSGVALVAWNYDLGRTSVTFCVTNYFIIIAADNHLLYLQDTVFVLEKLKLFFSK